MSMRITTTVVVAGLLVAGMSVPVSAAQVVPPRALVYIADQSEGGRVSVFDATTGQTAPGLGIPDSTFDNDDHNQVSVGDVNGDGRGEVLVANDSGGRIDVLDAAKNGPVPGLGIPDTRFNNDDHNQMVVGQFGKELPDTATQIERAGDGLRRDEHRTVGCDEPA